MSANLTQDDFKILLSAIAELNSDFQPETLETRTLAAASIIAVADSAAFTGFLADGTYADLMWNNSGDFSPQEMEIFAAYIHENPLFDAFFVEKRIEALKITDLISSFKFQKTTIYNDFYRRVGVSNQLVKPMRVSGELTITCSLNVENRDFTERDKAMLDLITPHFANAIRNSLAYSRLSSALETESSGIISIGSKGEPLFVSEYARRLLSEYFAADNLKPNALPETLAEWLNQVESISENADFTLPPAPLKIKSSTGVLTIRCMSNSVTREKTLLLQEKKSISLETLKKLNLTKRETEILFWMAQGKTDDVIAKLSGISIRTVHKHAEHIYSKLGVETRTSALLKVFENW